MLISYCNIQSQIMKLELPSNGGIIGYDGANFIVLDETGVSSLHMRLSYIDDKLFAEDLQSLNGTYLNRNLLTEKTEIKNGDSILIGLVLLRFEKFHDSWSITAIRQDSSLFVVDEPEALIDTDNDEDNATAVTIVASGDITDAIKSGDFGKLQKDSFQKISPGNSTHFSFDALQELGKYKIIRKIGKGGMGVVFLAKHKVMNTYRALKVLPNSVKEDNYDFFERFIREARIASDIRHPNIVGVMDVETDYAQKVSYIVMEFIDGGTLRRILKTQGTLAEIQALLIVKSVAEALKFINEHKIIHRDIKPDNIMFTRHGEVKLADLGIAKQVDGEVDLTKNDMMIGTPAYLSLEQIETPGNVDIRSDIYSLGVTFYEMLTGTTPYAGKNAYDVLQKMVLESAVDPRKINPRVSAITAKTVMKMLHKNPAKRYQTPQELLDALDEVLPPFSISAASDIVRAAVLGTGLPACADQTISSGLMTSLKFMFFNFRRRIAENFSQSARHKIKQAAGSTASGNSFSFQIDTETAAYESVDFIISASAATDYKVFSTAGYCKQITSTANGALVLKNLPPGEYWILPQKQNIK